MDNKNINCTLTDAELIEKSNQWVKELCLNGGKVWIMNIPARPNEDPDLIFAELNNRFKAMLQLKERCDKMEAALQWIKTYGPDQSKEGQAFIDKALSGEPTNENDIMNNKQPTASFTKGEWYLQKHSDAYTNIVRCNNGKGNETIFIGSTTQVGTLEARANAQLMSAAPDLLKALQEVIAISDRKHDAWDKAKAAIGKAIGQWKDGKGKEAVCTCSLQQLAAHGECHKCPGQHTRHEIINPTK